MPPSGSYKGGPPLPEEVPVSGREGPLAGAWQPAMAGARSKSEKDAGAQYGGEEARQEFSPRTKVHGGRRLRKGPSSWPRLHAAAAVEGLHPFFKIAAGHTLRGPPFSAACLWEAWQLLPGRLIGWTGYTAL